MQKVETKKQNIIPQKAFNRYKTNDKVLLFSNTYRWGKVKEVTISKDKKSFVYIVVFSDGSKPMKCTEKEVLPYVPKWQWKLLAWLKIVY